MHRRAWQHLGMGASYYDLLGVTGDASDDVLDTAHRALVRALHPDAHPDWDEATRRRAEERLIEVNAAWQVLGDPGRRALYDRTLPPPRSFPSDASGREARETPRHEADDPWAMARRWPSPPGEKAPPEGFTWRGATSVPGSIRLQSSAGDLSSLSSWRGGAITAIDCDGQPVTDPQLLHLRGLAGLRAVDLGDTLVGDEGMSHLVGLDELSDLQLWATRVGDMGLSVLSHMPSLRHLGLGHTRVTDIGLAAIGRIPVLNTLDLRGTRVRGSGLHHLHQVQGLSLVHLPKRIDREIRASLRAAHPHAVLLP